MKLRILSFLFILTLTNTYLLSKSDNYQCASFLNCQNETSACPYLNLNCTNKPSQQLTISNDCFLNIDGILKRTMKFINLVRLREDDPDAYCANIELMLNLDIAMLKSTAEHWGPQDHIFWTNLCPMVCDINRAYDCAGKPRPIFSFGNYELVRNNVQYYEICEEVKLVFQDEISNLSLPMQKYYQTATHFVMDSIVYEGNPSGPSYCHPDCGVPDISRIETKMYMYYVAMRFINCGFSAIDMSHNMAKYMQNDPTYEHTYSLIMKIKEYAKNTNGEQFLIGGGTEKLKVAGTDNLLFDYIFTPMRPVDTTGYFTQENACSKDPLEAYIDPDGHGDQPFNDTGGVTPNGCEIEDCVPILLDFDHHEGIETDAIDGPGVADTLHYSVYGYDESAWWDHLSPDCQNDWFTYYYCNLDNAINCRTYLLIPGRITANPWPSVYWNAIDNPSFANQLESLLDTQIPSIDVEQECQYTTVCDNKITLDGDCCLYNERKGGRTVYSLSIVNQDCSTAYGWHIKKPDGTWLPFNEVDETYTLIPEQIGVYEITLEVENPVLLASNPQFSLPSIEINHLYEQCCDSEYSFVSIDCSSAIFCPSIDNACVNDLIINTSNTPFQNIYESRNSITTQGTVVIPTNQHVKYNSNQVTLNQGFSAEARTDFEISISGCK